MPSLSKQAEKRLTWWCVGLVLAGPVLGIGAGALGAAEFYPSDHATTVAVVVMCAVVGLGLMIASCAGFYALAGPRATPLGVLFVGSIGVLTFGLATADDVWRDVGTILLGISCGSFWAVPALLRREPTRGRNGRQKTTTTVKGAGVGGVVVVGLVLAVIGHAAGVWYVMLFGTLAVGTACGGVIAVLTEARRAKPDVA